MKWLLACLLWAVAIALAAAIVCRFRRGRPVILRGTWSPRVVRMVAILLVATGYSPDGPQARSHAGPMDGTRAPDGEALPPVVTRRTLESWHVQQSPRNPWMTLKQEYTRWALRAARGPEAPPPQLLAQINRLPPVLRRHFEADVAAVGALQVVAPGAADLLAVLDAAEAAGFFDHWLNAHLWRETARMDPKERPAVFSRLRRHARVTDTIIMGFAQIKPALNVSPRAWMSKAGPTPETEQAVQRYQSQLDEVIVLCGRLYGTTGEGTWQRDGVTRFRVGKDSAAFQLSTGPRWQVQAPGAEFRFGRLDALVAAVGEVVLEHPWLGSIAVPAGRTVSAWDLPALLSDEQLALLNVDVAAALDGSEAAAARIEAALPLTHAALRARLQERPDAPSAPRMRLILSLFDDAPMPAPDLAPHPLADFGR